jgi:hypothetical protein
MERLLGLALALILELQNQSDLDRKATNFCTETAFSATRDLILTAPRPIRAVLLNGLREVDDIELEGIENVMFHSKPREDVYKALISIIKSAELAELSSIASSDYGYMTEKHLKALQFVVASDNCKYPKDGEWYPAEVVELSSHVSSNGGYLIATAIVFLNALYDNDGCSHMEFRWENQHEYYKTLNDPYRSAFLAAVRSEYECIFYFLELNVDASTENPNAAFIPWDFSPPLKQT